MCRIAASVAPVLPIPLAALPSAWADIKISIIGDQTMAAQSSLRSWSVQPFVHVLSGLKIGCDLLTDRHICSSPRVSPRTRCTVSHRKRAETTQLDPVAACERHSDLAENRVKESFNIALVEVGVVRDDALDEL
jgi:hypothetical protein